MKGTRLLYLVCTVILLCPNLPQACKSQPRTTYTGMPEKIYSLRKSELPIQALTFYQKYTNQEGEAIQKEIDGLTKINNVKTLTTLIAAGVKYWDKGATSYAFEAIFSILISQSSMNALTSRLLETKMDEKLISTAIQSYAGILNVTSRRMEMFLDPGVALQERIEEARIAINSCQILLYAFQSPDHVLYQGMEASHTYFFIFAEAYALIGRFMLTYRKEYNNQVRNDFETIKELLKVYGNAGWAERLALVDIAREDRSDCRHIYYYVSTNELIDGRRTDTNASDPSSTGCVLPSPSESSRVQGFSKIVPSLADRGTGKVLCMVTDSCLTSYIEELKRQYFSKYENLFLALNLDYSPETPEEESTQQEQSRVLSLGRNSNKGQCYASFVHVPENKPRDFKCVNSIYHDYEGIRARVCGGKVGLDFLVGNVYKNKCHIGKKMQHLGIDRNAPSWFVQLEHGKFKFLSHAWQGFGDTGRLVWKPWKSGTPVPSDAFKGGFVRHENGTEVPLYVGSCYYKVNHYNGMGFVLTNWLFSAGSIYQRELYIAPYWYGAGHPTCRHKNDSLISFVLVCE